MKIVVKRIHCPTCQKLVRGRAQKTGSQVQVSCPTCGHPLQLWTGTSWRILHETD